MLPSLLCAITTFYRFRCTVFRKASAKVLLFFLLAKLFCFFFRFLRFFFALLIFVKENGGDSLLFPLLFPAFPFFFDLVEEYLWAGCRLRVIGFGLISLDSWESSIRQALLTKNLQPKTNNHTPTVFIVFSFVSYKAVGWWKGLVWHWETDRQGGLPMTD